MRAVAWALGWAICFAAAAGSPGCAAGDQGMGAGGAAGAGGSTSSGSGGFSSQSCEPACVPPQFCSVSGVCLDEGQCTATEDCVPGAECDPSGECTGCKPPNFLLVLDRSCSMTGQVSGLTKWQIAVQAINEVTAVYEGTIRFGLSLFPDVEPPECEQGAVVIPVADGNEAAIQALLTASQNTSDVNYPDGPCITNIDTAVQQASAEPSFEDIERVGFVVLITDGKQYGCDVAGGDAGTTQMITDMFDSRGIATFVVGFGSAVDPDQLNLFADAGGVPTSDLSCAPEPCRFYKAEDASTLADALDTIAKSVRCDDPLR